MGDDGSVTSGGSGAFNGSGTEGALLRALVNTGQHAYLALRADGTIVFASESAREVTTWEPAALLGGNALDWIHPDDAERAVLQLSELNVAGSAPGTSLFRVRRVDGSWFPVEILASIVHDGEETLIGLSLRNAEHELFLEDLLDQMVNGALRADALRLVCDAVDWRQYGSSVAISWSDDEGLRQVSTGLPNSLGGADPGTGTPWDLARRDGQARQGTSSELDPLRVELAAELGLGAFWVEPVRWAPHRVPATITIWTEEGPRAPALHAYGMGRVRNFVELVLRWTEEAARLDQAARSDSLTGLVNHRTFYSLLADASAGGAILYCDLDHFKPVNDKHGHSVGDALLRMAARRIERCVRQADVVGRLGGDEFVVLCHGADESGALEVAKRILRSLREPFRVGEAEEPVHIDASIGVAVSTSAVSEDLLKAADRALSTAKSAGRGRVSLAVEAPPPDPA